MHGPSSPDLNQILRGDSLDGSFWGDPGGKVMKVVATNIHKYCNCHVWIFLLKSLSAVDLFHQVLTCISKKTLLKVGE